ncbi:hypothetical protein SK854_11460 [Lentzea sp. BCCO 10_0061]|uniref:Uncharacterized protein n=1 Tax=Lentzea sokolovensis TaxID=3095429 RepID=A0ABU4UTG5_9PSEU|nr:hypothetical protein [Lentzea sp. BCCO 10_0061]MDX8142731.1 hypothetical protein [Lentzea sp. BCCO 10_0061]
MPDDEQTFEFTAVRRPGNARETPSWRFRVREGCWVTLFDDGRTRFLMDPTEEYKVEHKNRDADHPGTKLIETKPKR